MPSQSEFEEDGRVVWDEVERPPTDMFRMQAAMFKDRPDLWPMKRRPAHRTVVQRPPGPLAYEAQASPSHG